MSRIEMEGGWAHELDAVVAGGLIELFDDKLGPAILADAQRLVPVDTGRLLKSLDMQVRDDGRLPVLEVGSFPDSDGPVPYAAAVEFGFHGTETVRAHSRLGHAVREHTRQANTPEQPYLRPAIYQERDI